MKRLLVPPKTFAARPFAAQAFAAWNLAIFVFLFACPAAADEGFDVSWLEDFVQQQLTNHDIPGASVAFVEDGKTRLARGFGLADIKQKQPVTERTLFRIGSVSKLFVWTSLWQLFEQGKLTPDDAIEPHLCGHAIAHTFAEPIRVSHLMDHTAGFDSLRRGTYARSPDELVSLQALIANETPPRVRPPGLVEAYSNFGTCLAARVVECVSEETFERYVVEHTIEPLGMPDATFAQPLAVDAEKIGEKPVSKGYSRVGAGLKEEAFELIRMAPAGAMSASARDMAAFMRALLGANPAWMSEETLRQMQRGSHVPSSHLGGLAHGFFVVDHDGLRMLWHGGDTTQFHTLLVLIPARKVGLFVSYNAPEGAIAYREIMSALREKIAPSLPLVASAWGPPLNVEGFYRSSRVALSTYEKLEARSTDLRVQLDEPFDGSREGNGIVVEDRRWVAVAPWVFQESDGTDRLVFDVDSEGKVERLRIASRPTQTYEHVIGSQRVFGTVDFSSVVAGLLAVGLLFVLSSPFVQILARTKANCVLVRVWKHAAWKHKELRFRSNEVRKYAVPFLYWITALVALSLLGSVERMARNVPDDWIYSTPFSIEAVHFHVVLLLILILTCVVGSWGVWRKRRSSVFWRLHRGVTLFSAVCVVAFVVRWGLVW